MIQVCPANWNGSSQFVLKNRKDIIIINIVYIERERKDSATYVWILLRTYWKGENRIYVIEFDIIKIKF